MNKNRDIGSVFTVTSVGCFAVFVILAKLAFWGVIIYAVAHFVAKYW